MLPALIILLLLTILVATEPESAADGSRSSAGTAAGGMISETGQGRPAKWTRVRRMGLSSHQEREMGRVSEKARSIIKRLALK